MNSMAARAFKISPEAWSKILRKAILGPDDVTILLTQGQRNALSARSKQVPASAGRQAAEPQKP